MMRLLLAAILICSTSVICVEEDEFTQQLQLELEELLNENEHVPVQPRSRRSSDDGSELANDEHFKCKQHTKKSCCGKTNLFKHFGDQNKTLGKLCNDEVSSRLKQDSLQQLETPSLFSCEKYKLMKKLQYCAVECIGKKRNLLTDDGNINIPEMRKYLSNELFKEAWQTELSDNILAKCLNEKYMEWPQDEPGTKCNPIAVQFVHCLWKEYETNCPRTEQKDSKKCHKLRNYLKQQNPDKRKP